MTWLGHINDVALTITAVLACLTAIGVAAKRTRRWWKQTARPFAEKVDMVLDLAAYELQQNGGGSIKDAAARIGPLEEKVDAHIEQSRELVEQGREVRSAIEKRLGDLESQHADTVAHLAEALPVIARAVPHPVDAHLPTTPDPAQEAS
ncbi:hypothetical protein ACK8HX_02040 [Oryzobacter sp. R7]|uniref:hypothetical protein n=1 Tax=Oryzobacter faecalis TaxID=3388656 RepID=UPI00398C8474